MAIPLESDRRFIKVASDLEPSGTESRAHIEPPADAGLVGPGAVETVYRALPGSCCIGMQEQQDVTSGWRRSTALSWRARAWWRRQ